MDVDSYKMMLATDMVSTNDTRDGQQRDVEVLVNAQVAKSMKKAIHFIVDKIQTMFE